MEHFDMVEKLIKKADVSYEEARDALEAADWDMLDAIVYLERAGKIHGGQPEFTTKQEHKKHSKDKRCEKKRNQGWSNFMKSLGRMIQWGNENFLEVERGGDVMFSLPITVCAMLLFFAFWITVPLLVIGLFFGYHYSFRGTAGNHDALNRAMDKASQAADHIKREVKEHGREAGEEIEEEIEKDKVWESDQ